MRSPDRPGFDPTWSEEKKPASDKGLNPWEDEQKGEAEFETEQQKGRQKRDELAKKVEAAQSLAKGRRQSKLDRVAMQKLAADQQNRTESGGYLTRRQQQKEQEKRAAQGEAEIIAQKTKTLNRAKKADQIERSIAKHAAWRESEFIRGSAEANDAAGVSEKKRTERIGEGFIKEREEEITKEFVDEQIKLMEKQEQLEQLRSNPNPDQQTLERINDLNDEIEEIKLGLTNLEDRLDKVRKNKRARWEITQEEELRPSMAETTPPEFEEPTAPTYTEEVPEEFKQATDQEIEQAVERPLFKAEVEAELEKYKDTSLGKKPLESKTFQPPKEEETEISLPEIPEKTNRLMHKLKWNRTKAVRDLQPYNIDDPDKYLITLQTSGVARAKHWLKGLFSPEFKKRWSTYEAAQTTHHTAVKEERAEQAERAKLIESKQLARERRRTKR